MPPHLNQDSPSADTRRMRIPRLGVKALIVASIVLPASLSMPQAQAADIQDQRSGLQIAQRVLNSPNPKATLSSLSPEDKGRFASVMYPSATHVKVSAVGLGSIAGERLSGDEAEKLLSAEVGTTLAVANNGSCESGEFCYYYNSYKGGSMRDFSSSSLASYISSTGSCYTFKSAGAGQGVCVKNNAASVWNRTPYTVKVYYNSNYGGASQSFASGASGNLNSTLKNNNASHRASTTTSSTCWSVNARGSSTAAAGNTLYTYWQTTKICVSSGRVSSVSVPSTLVGGETSTPGWRIDKPATTSVLDVDWEGRGLAQYYFVLGVAGYDIQHPTTCLQQRLNANLVSKLSNTSCSLS
jgi:hypothetical protein